MPNDRNILRIESPSAACNQLISTAQRAKRHLDILSHALVLYDNDALQDALSHFVRRHRSLQARILIKDSNPLVGRSHRLVTLAQRLPSKIRLKTLDKDAPPLKDSYCLIDNSLVYFETEMDSIGFSADDPALTRHYRNSFDELWQHQSHADTQLSQLFI